MNTGSGAPRWTDPKAHRSRALELSDLEGNDFDPELLLYQLRAYCSSLILRVYVPPALIFSDGVEVLTVERGWCELRC